MKKTILIISIAFSIIFLWFILINNIDNDKKSYEKNIELAEVYFDAELYYDACDKYEKLIEYHNCKDSRYKIALCKKNLDLIEEYILSMRDILEEYPESSEILDEILSYYLKEEKYDNMKSLIEKYKDVKIYSDILNDYEGILRTKYILKFVSYESVNSLSDEYIVFEDKNGAGVASTRELNKYLKKYDKVGNFSNTEPAVSSVIKKNERFYVDKNGHRRIYLKYKYDYLGDFGNNGLAKFRRKDKCGYINLKGDEIEDCFYDCVDFYDSKVSFIKNNFGWKIVNENIIPIGNEMFESVYIEDKRSFSCGRAFVKKEAKYALVNEKGVLLSNYIFDKVNLFRENDAFAAVKIGDEYAFIDSNGNIHKCLDCDDLGSYSCGIAAIKIDEKWGYLDAEGNILIKPVFDMSFYVNKYGITAVKLDGSIYILNLVYY